MTLAMIKFFDNYSDSNDHALFNCSFIDEIAKDEPVLIECKEHHYIELQKLFRLKFKNFKFQNFQQILPSSSWSLLAIWRFLNCDEQTPSYVLAGGFKEFTLFLLRGNRNHHFVAHSTLSIIDLSLTRKLIVLATGIMVICSRCISKANPATLILTRELGPIKGRVWLSVILKIVKIEVYHFIPPKIAPKKVGNPSQLDLIFVGSPRLQKDPHAFITHDYPWKKKIHVGKKQHFENVKFVEYKTLLERYVTTRSVLWAGGDPEYYLGSISGIVADAVSLNLPFVVAREVGEFISTHEEKYGYTKAIEFNDGTILFRPKLV